MNFKSLLIKDTSKKKKFWKVAESFEDLIQTRFKKQCKISLKGPLNKYSNNAQKLESYIFFLVGPYFGYHKTNSKAVKYFDLTTSILKPISTESSSSSYGFSLIRHSIKSKDFFCNNQPEVEKWYKLLKKFCIQIEFAVNYELQDQIGKGNFATVHKAKSKKDGNLYAVKIIESQGLAKSVKLRHAVRTEVSIHRGLHHPHILRFFEVYEDEEKIYMVFQLLEGGELFDRVLKRKKYTEREAAIVMRQLLEALVYLESKRIIHRDLKLENILLVNKEDDCLIKLADFGLSVTLENLDPKVRCGTPGYVAPEIITGKAYDCKTDMFSAGAILYVL